MGENQPGWYYEGSGKLRYMDSDGWTDQYKPIEGPRTALKQVTESSKPTPSSTSAKVKKPHRRMSLLVIALCVGLVGVGGGIAKPDVLHAATSWAAEQAGQISALASPPEPTAQAIAIRPTAKPKPKVPAKVTPPKAVVRKAIEPKALTAPMANDAPSEKASPVTRAPAVIDDFDKEYALYVTLRLVEDIATADERFLDQPELGASRTMDMLSANMGRLLSAGMPPVADKAHYYALVTTLEEFYGKAAYQLPDDVIGAAATYTVARKATSELLGLLNPVLGTKYALPKWSFM